MDNEKNLNEKLSALFDGELDLFEIQNVLESVSESKDLQKKLSHYALISSALNKDNTIEVYDDLNRKTVSYTHLTLPTKRIV